jgi:hypothetical protein
MWVEARLRQGAQADGIANLFSRARIDLRMNGAAARV